MSFSTSEEIYYRIKTDPNLIPAKCIITYHDSISDKYVDIPHQKWVPIKNGGDIPFHRVYFIKYDGTIIWDRNKKLCTINNIIEKQIRKLNELFTVCSFNIMSDIYKKNITDINKRKNDLLAFIFNYDIICLQEVTFLDELKNHNDYDIAYTSLSENNLCILSRATILNVQTIKLSNRKEILVVDVTDNNNNIIKIYNVHLTSNSQANASVKRQIQLDVLNNHIEPNCIVAGDFNINDKIIPISNDMVDVGIQLNNLEPTHCPTTNKFAQIFSKDGIDKRYDRIYYYSKFLQPQNLVIDKVILSDHYPIICTFKLNEQILIEPTLDKVNVPKLCAIIPFEHWNIINEFRSKYDPTFDDWMPHISILKHTILKTNIDINKICIKHLPITLHIAKFNYLDHISTSTLCLDFDDDSKNKLHKLYLEICNELNIRSEQFNPHITLGKFRDNDKSFIKKSVPINNIIIDKLQIVSKEEYNAVQQIFGNSSDDIMNIINHITRMFPHNEIKIGGSAIFSLKTCHDIDLVIIGNNTANEFFNYAVKLFKTCGEFVNVELISNDHTNYIKLDSIIKHFDIHYCQKNSNDIKSINALSVYAASQKVLMLMDLMKDQFIENLEMIKKLARESHVYGQMYGYLSGLSIAVLVAITMLKFKNNTNFINNFCDYWSSYDYSKPISINEHSIKDEPIRNMVIVCPVAPYNNLCRTMTKSTFLKIKDCFSHNFSNNNYVNYVSTSIIIRSDDNKMINNYINWFNTIYTKIVLWLEKITDKFVVPNDSWIMNNGKIYKYEAAFVFRYNEILKYYEPFQKLLTKSYELFKQLEIIID